MVGTDLAFAAANSASQLLGGESYRTDTYIGRAAADLRPFRIFEGSNDVLCDAIWQAAEKAAKTGGESFETTVRRAFGMAGVAAPSVAAFAADPLAGPLPQGLRCLGGRILANAVVLRWCVEAGSPLAAVQPLLGRMARDVLAADLWPSGAGLLDY